MSNIFIYMYKNMFMNINNNVIFTGCVRTGRELIHMYVCVPAHMGIIKEKRSKNSA